MIILGIFLLLCGAALWIEYYAFSMEREMKRAIIHLADASLKRLEKKRTWPRP